MLYLKNHFHPSGGFKDIFFCRNYNKFLKSLFFNNP